MQLKIVWSCVLSLVVVVYIGVNHGAIDLYESKSSMHRHGYNVADQVQSFVSYEFIGLQESKSGIHRPANNMIGEVQPLVGCSEGFTKENTRLSVVETFRNGTFSFHITQST